MNVSDFAKVYGLKIDDVLAELKHLKMRSKDGKQELSAAVLAVLKSSFESRGRKIVAFKKEEKPVAVVEKKIEKAEKPEKSEPLLKGKAAKATKAKPAAEGKSKAKDEKKTSVKKTAVKEKAEKTTAKEEKKPSSKKIKLESEVVVEKVSSEVRHKEPAKKITAEKPLPVAKAELPKVEIAKPQPAAKSEPSKVEIVRPLPVAHHRPKPFSYQGKRFDGRRYSPEPHKPHVASVSADLVQRPLKDIELEFPVSVKDLSVKLQQKPSAVLKVLMQRGILATINKSLDEDVILKIKEELNFSYTKAKTKEEELVAFHTEQDDSGVKKARPPVITFMGHVDHGKTSLLDRVRKSNIVDKEHGGITQHMAAYSVTTPRGKITFLDTPGHAAFTAMRARGAHITDLVILVVAADEGVMPQTEEAINHARAAKVPIVVAINKIDKKNVNLDRVKKQLAGLDLNPEDWGGKTITVNVSATTGEGVDKLLEMILLESELLELKANYDRPGLGIVVEAHLSHGKGSVASIIVQNGTLKEGDIVVAGPCMGKIKAMTNDYGVPMGVATPAMPAEILGLSGVPEAGEIFYVVPDERKAREICETRLEQIKNKRLQSTQKITLEDLYAQIQQGKVKELNIILKTDVQGSLEALRDSLLKLSNDEVQIKFIHTGTGDINAADVILAQVSNAIIVGFHVQADTKAEEELVKQPVDVRTYRIIYDAVDDIKKALSGLLEPKIRKKFMGRIDIREVFKLSKSGVVAGCFVQKGRVDRKAKIVIMRNSQEVYSGEISSLKRFKDDVREVREGFECGITIKGFAEIQPGDVIEAYELETIQREL